jgi:hypothetical protein
VCVHGSCVTGKRGNVRMIYVSPCQRFMNLFLPFCTRSDAASLMHQHLRLYICGCYVMQFQWQESRRGGFLFFLFPGFLFILLFYHFSSSSPFILLFLLSSVFILFLFRPQQQQVDRQIYSSHLHPQVITLCERTRLLKNEIERG